MGEKELQEKIVTFRFMEARLESLAKHRDMVMNKVMELESTLNSIEEINKSDGEVMFPIGGEAFKIAKSVDKDRIIIEIGANVALEKTTEEGKTILKKRKDEMENFIKQAQQEILQVTNAMNQLGPEIQDLAKKAQSEAG